MTFNRQLAFLIFIIVSYNAVELLRPRWKAFVGLGKAPEGLRFESMALVVIALVVIAVGGAYFCSAWNSLASLYSSISAFVACAVAIGVPVLALFLAIFKAGVQFQRLRLPN